MYDYNIQPTFLFHDYETFGASPSLDRPAQFAAIRTDINLNIIDDPNMFYCKPADDYLPQPNAVLITGITPQKARIKGVNEAEFARRIYNLFSIPNTCIIGYNNINFDDEITRNILYRNFYDPYTWSWANHNSRWDILKVIRACYALRPEGISWSKNDAGLPSFRLEDLTSANSITHNNTHSAIADVHATIAIAKLIKNTQPKLFNYLFLHRSKKKIISLINVSKMTPLVHISSIFGARRGNTSLVAPLSWHPENHNIVIMIDLGGNITALLELIKRNALHFFTHASKQSINDKVIAPIKLVHINKCPILVKANVLRPKDAERLGINIQYCLYNLKLLRENFYIRNKVVALCAKIKPFIASNNVDAQLYNGFFNKEDRAALKILLQTKPCNLSTLNITFTDQRIKKLIFNYRARNFPETLDETEQECWLEYRRNIFTPKFLHTYIEELKMLFSKYDGDIKKQNLLRSLWQYVQEIV